MPDMLAVGGAAFKTGPIGQCQICGCRAEVGPYEDGRMICGDCNVVMVEGKRKNIESGRISPDAAVQIAHPSVQSTTPATWNSIDLDEKSRYLEIIKAASAEVIKSVISNLVNSNVLELDFHKIIQNERWFSIMDLRRIAFQVNPSFEKPLKNLPKVADKGMKAKRSNTLCQTKSKHKSQTQRSNQQPQPLPQLQPIPKP